MGDNRQNSLDSATTRSSRATAPSPTRASSGAPSSCLAGHPLVHPPGARHLRPAGPLGAAAALTAGAGRPRTGGRTAPGPVAPTPAARAAGRLRALLLRGEPSAPRTGRVHGEPRPPPPRALGAPDPAPPAARAVPRQRDRSPDGPFCAVLPRRFGPGNPPGGLPPRGDAVTAPIACPTRLVSRRRTAGSDPPVGFRPGSPIRDEGARAWAEAGRARRHAATATAGSAAHCPGWPWPSAASVPRRLRLGRPRLPSVHRAHGLHEPDRDLRGTRAGPAHRRRRRPARRRRRLHRLPLVEHPHDQGGGGRRRRQGRLLRRPGRLTLNGEAVEEPYLHPGIPGTSGQPPRPNSARPCPTATSSSSETTAPAPRTPVCT